VDCPFYNLATVQIYGCTFYGFRRYGRSNLRSRRASLLDRACNDVVHRLEVGDESLGRPFAAAGCRDERIEELLNCLHHSLEERRIAPIQECQEVRPGEGVADDIAYELVSELRLGIAFLSLKSCFLIKPVVDQWPHLRDHRRMELRIGEL
jgi:hypothetical protein